MKQRWTQEEIEFLRESYSLLSLKVVCEKLGRSRSSVSTKAFRLGLNGRKKCGHRRGKRLPYISELDIAWAAGLMEGEGTFGSTRQITKLKRKNVYSIHNQPRVQLQMQDKDVVERFARLVDCNLLGPYENKRSDKSFSKEHKLCWVVGFAGYKASQFMKLVKPHLGERRQYQIDQSLKSWGTIRQTQDPVRFNRNKEPMRRKLKPVSVGLAKQKDIKNENRKQ